MRVTAVALEFWVQPFPPLPALGSVRHLNTSSNELPIFSKASLNISFSLAHKSHGVKEFVSNS